MVGKLLLTTIAIILGVLCLGSSVMAEEFAVYGDYSIMSSGADANTLTMGGNSTSIR